MNIINNNVLFKVGDRITINTRKEDNIKRDYECICADCNIAVFAQIIYDKNNNKDLNFKQLVAYNQDKDYIKSLLNIGEMKIIKREREKMELKIDSLEKCFYIASQNEIKYVGVLIEMEGFPEPELIINKNKNFDSKFDYYKKTYDENLNHKYAKGIRIIDFTYENSLADIEQDLFKDK